MPESVERILKAAKGLTPSELGQLYGAIGSWYRRPKATV